MTTLTHSRVGAGPAALWAAGYGTLALGWTATGRGFPFGTADAGAGASPLRTLTPALGAPVFAGVLLLTAVLALILNGRADPRGPVRFAILAYAWSVVALLLVVVPDVRLLTLAGYLPVLIIGAPFGYPPVDVSDVLTWTLVNQVLCVAGGLLLARATLRWQFRTGEACLDCGRGPRDGGWATPRSAARWGRWATGVAFVIPTGYALTRLAWAAGVPVGIAPEFLADMHDTGLVWAGAGLGAFALVGAVLTLGLTQHWGEVFPRWMPLVGGHRVPIRLATIPATLVAVLVTSASIGFLTTQGFFTEFTGTLSAATLPMAFWPLWGLALGAATLAYHLRRRTGCVTCGRGDADAPLVPAKTGDAY